MKLNNKGFMITGILYSLLLLFLALIIGMLAILSAKQNKMTYISKNIVTKLNDKYDINAIKVWTFNYTGNYQTFVAPTDGYYNIQLWGASGDDISNCTWSGCTADSEKISKGSYDSGIIYLNKGENLYIYVGEKGTSGVDINNYSVFNGGGTVSDAYIDGNNFTGGGATDIRLVSGSWNDFNSLKSRIMVAGGAGGVVYPVITEGHGGTYYSNVAYGPISSSANAAGQNNGFKFGIGQNGLRAGGGGGYYGGFASNYTGSGGSSFISGLYGCNAIAESSTEDNIIHTGQPIHYSKKVFYNGVMIDGDSEMPTHDGTSTMMGNTGNGFAKISLISNVGTFYKIGEQVTIGDYTWHVYGEDNLSVYLFMDGGQLPSMLHCTPDHDDSVDCGYNGTYTVYSWDKSIIRAYLNGDFYNSLSPAIKDKIVTTRVCSDPSLISSVSYSYGGYTDTEIASIEDATCSSYTTDYVRLMTLSEYHNLSDKYADVSSYPVANGQGLIPMVSYISRLSANDWLYSTTIGKFWLTGTLSYKSSSTVSNALNVDGSGTIGANGAGNIARAVRPVIVLRK